MQPASTWVRPVVDRALRRPLTARGAARLGARRGRGLALLWHRVGPDGPARDEAVPTVATAAFAAQLDLLLELGDVVPLAELERPEAGRRPRFSLTFDDDDPGHVQHTLPVLRERGLPATFFLSGRWPDRGPYWWEVLERRIRREGRGEVAAAYGFARGADGAHLARELTGTEEADRLAAEALSWGAPPMTVGQARELVAAGMEIGFHTRDHPSLPTLQDEGIAVAVTEGRSALADDLGVPVRRFAYPHGHTDPRVIAATAAAGYRSAWTTSKRAVVRGADRMALGRWDLGHLPLDGFRSALLRAFVRPSP